MELTNHQYYNCHVHADNNQSFLMNANWLHNNNLDQWQNWQCHAGLDRIYISPTGNVYSGECQNDLLGHIDQNWQLFSQPTVCQQITCTGCTDDLIIEKQNVV